MCKWKCYPIKCVHFIFWDFPVDFYLALEPGSSCMPQHPGVLVLFTPCLCSFLRHPVPLGDTKPFPSTCKPSALAVSIEFCIQLYLVLAGPGLKLQFIYSFQKLLLGKFFSPWTPPVLTGPAGPSQSAELFCRNTKCSVSPWYMWVILALTILEVLPRGEPLLVCRLLMGSFCCCWWVLSSALERTCKLPVKLCRQPCICGTAEFTHLCPGYSFRMKSVLPKYKNR